MPNNGGIMNRPTLALACILKNEVENLPRLLESVEGCFDKIYLSDTGSTDGTVELIQRYMADVVNPSRAPIQLQQFPWPNDFSEARNKSFEPVKEEYCMWLDLDDVLSDKNKFIEWRDNLMNIADFWLATYHYASDHKGVPIVSFCRERVVSMRHGFKWKYFVHEGMSPESKIPAAIQYATSWSVIHKRTEEDVKKDKSRNLSLFDLNKDKVCSRMYYYWGKEYYESGQPLEAISKLFHAIEDKKLEGHDRIMAVQYACLSAMQLNQFEKAINLAHQGMQLDPQRAEFAIICADSYLKLNQFQNAIPYYILAANCDYNPDRKMHGALFSHRESYTVYPHLQLAKIYANGSNLEKAKGHIKIAKSYEETPEVLETEAQITEIEKNAVLPEINLCKHTEDILISCHPSGLYEWDEEIYKTKGIGGSETAVVEMARHLHDLTGRKVLVYNARNQEKEFNGVHYIPAGKIIRDMGDKLPKLHVSWRHTVKLSNVPAYVWCHDLMAPGIEHLSNYNKVLALSDFHKQFLKSLFSVPEEKIIVTANGINLSKFSGLDTSNKPTQKVVFSSSPDRGLDRALMVMDRVVESLPKAELHVYYGFDNMYKLGKNEAANKLKAEIEKRPYVKFHGNMEQTELYKELSSAKVWLYPTDFLETYCITALEMLACRVVPVVRSYGALPNTLSGCREAIILNQDCKTEEDFNAYAKEVVHALAQDKWKTINYDLEKHSWQNVARSWIELFSL